MKMPAGRDVIGAARATGVRAPRRDLGWTVPMPMPVPTTRAEAATPERQREIVHLAYTEMPQARNA
jgi:hypothetical protein